MRITALLVAAIGAFVGAAIWAVIAATTGYEVGYVAWGIGLLVGFGAKIAGGVGKPLAAACAGLALIGIFGGKMMAVRYDFAKQTKAMLEALTSKERYQEDLRDAADFAALKSEDEYAAFMVTHKYIDDEQPAPKVTAEDVQEFKEHSVPHLKKLHADKPSYEQWRESCNANLAENFRPSISMSGMARVAMSQLGAMDLVFALLGVATAYRVALSSGEEKAA